MLLPSLSPFFKVFNVWGPGKQKKLGLVFRGVRFNTVRFTGALSGVRFTALRVERSTAVRFTVFAAVFARGFCYFLKNITNIKNTTQSHIRI